MKKICFAFLLTVIFVISSLSASAKSVITVGDWTVEKTENNEFSVVSCSSASSNITLVKEIGGLKVTAISEYAFAGSETVKTFTAYEPLREIGGYAFQNAAKLRSVSLPYSLKTIGVFAFAGTSALSSINLEDTSVSKIPAYAFMSSGIQSAELPETCTYIANNAFLNCKSLKTIDIPDTVTEIGDKAFDGCDNLTILCDKGSYAEKYAKSHGISVKCVVLCGDADDSGDIDVIDATFVQRYAIGASIPCEDTIMQADVDGSGTVESVDATFIMRHLIHINVPYAIGEYKAM